MRTLFILVILYIFWRLISRYLLYRKFIQQHFEQMNQSERRKNEGEIHIVQKRPHARKSDEQGEYTDFEEL